MNRIAGPPSLLAGSDEPLPAVFSSRLLGPVEFDEQRYTEWVRGSCLAAGMDQHATNQAISSLMVSFKPPAIRDLATFQTEEYSPSRHQLRVTDLFDPNRSLLHGTQHFIDDVSGLIDIKAEAMHAQTVRRRSLVGFAALVLSGCVFNALTFLPNAPQQAHIIALAAIGATFAITEANEYFGYHATEFERRARQTEKRKDLHFIEYQWSPLRRLINIALNH